MNQNDLIELARAAIDIQGQAIDQLKARVNDDFIQACQIILKCHGRVVVTGIGKSGHIGTKIAATFASTGTPAFFVHSGEASHGDLGMITAQDVVVALSNSGETAEILLILPIIKRLKVPLIALTGNLKSKLAQNADVAIDVSVAQEACPLDLAPTTSTTAALVMGDTLAIALLEQRGFSKEDFARSHPSGSLGRRLLLKVADIMHGGAALPLIASGSTVREALIEMTGKKLGMVAIVDQQQKVLGIFTDGDLRRTLDEYNNIKQLIIDDVMSKNCITVHDNILAEAALQIMEKQNINGLLLTNAEGVLTGALNMLDLVHAKVV